MSRGPLWVRVAAGITAVLLLLSVGAAYYLSVNPVDLSAFRNQIAAELQSATGREIKITGNIILGVSLRPTLVVEGLEIANLDWGRAEKFVSVGRTKIRVHLFPLFKGRADIISITASQVEVHLETDGDRRRNWNILAQAVTDTGEEAPLPEIEEIKISNMILGYRDIGDAEVHYRVNLEKAALEYDTVNGVGHYTLSGKLGDQVISAQGRIAPLYTISPEQPRQFDMKAQVFGLTLSADGSAKFPFKEFTYTDFTLAASKSLGLAAEYFGLGFPNLGAIRISGNLTPVGNHLHFGNLTARIGETDAVGHVIFSPGSSLKITSDLHSKNLDFDTYWDMLPTSTPPEGKLFYAAPLNMDLPQDVELDLRYAVQSLKMGDDSYSNFLLHAQMADKVLHITHLDMDMAGGRIANSLTLTPQAENLSLAVHSSASAINLSKLLKQFDMPKYAKGNVHVLLEGESTGGSMAELAARFNGRSYFELREGSIPKGLSSLIRGGFMNIFRSLQGMFDEDAKDARIECGFGAFVIREGIAENKALLMVTDKAVLSGKGKIDLGAERVNMKFSPRPKDNTLISLASDVDINGPLLSPDIGLNKASVAKSVGKTALGVALGPLGMIFGAAGSVISKPGGPPKDNRCVTTRTEAFRSLQASGPWQELVHLRAAQ